MSHSQFKLQKMKKLLFSAITFFLCMSQVLFGQNLVPNPSFEEYDSCPNNVAQLYKATGWSINVNTADYFNKCNSQGFTSFSVPSNSFGFQNAFTGFAYAGFFNIAKNILFQDAREYLGRKLSIPLVVGNKYFVSFKISFADGSDCATNKIGIKFTNTNFKDTTILPPPLVDNLSHLYTDNIIEDSLNWVTIEGSFVSDSAYEYFLIGNFFDYTHTDSVGSNCNSYYYIDDICISDDSLVCEMGVGIKLYSSPSFLNVSPNPVTDLLSISTSNFPLLITIYNNSAQEVYNSIEAKKEILIDVSGLTNGIYLLKAKSKNSFQVVKFLIQK